MLWGALWDYVHVAKTPPRGYVELALKSLPEETDESLARIQGARVAVALHSYLHEGARQSLTPRPESVIGDRMLKAPTLGLRIVSFRSFRSIAETPAGLQQVHRKIFFLGAWLGAFIEGQNSAEAQAVVQGWLAGEKIDSDLRLKVLEVFDSLERTVLIRKEFPDRPDCNLDHCFSLCELGRSWAHAPKKVYVLRAIRVSFGWFNVFQFGPQGLASRAGTTFFCNL
jgi:hypothetical protein